VAARGEELVSIKGGYLSNNVTRAVGLFSSRLHAYERTCLFETVGGPLSISQSGKEAK